MRRPDMVLTAIPVLVFSGVLLERLAPLLESTVGVGGTVSQLPLPVLGYLAASAVVIYGLARLPRHRASEEE